LGKDLPVKGARQNTGEAEFRNILFKEGQEKSKQKRLRKMRDFVDGEKKKKKHKPAIT